MDEKVLETIITNSIKIGCIQTLAQLGLMDDVVTKPQAYKMHGKKNIEEWRSKKWIVGYPTGNKLYYKRSELELASRMTDIYNAIPPSFLNRKTHQEAEDKSLLKEIKKRQ